MKLKLYLVANKISITDFCEKVGCNRGYMNDIANGKKIPGKHLAQAIEKETNGEITVKDLLNYDNKSKDAP